MNPRRSGGEHRWFRQPARQLRNRVGLKGERRDGAAYAYPGLDVRAAGGSAAAPPSRKPTGGYAWSIRPSSCSLADAPAWLLDLIDPPRPPPRPAAPMRFSTIDRAARYVEAAVNDECRGLATMGANTGRNLRLFQAAANLGELVAGGLLPQDTAEDALERAADECGLLHDDGRYAIRATIAAGAGRRPLRPLGATPMMEAHRNDVRREAMKAMRAAHHPPRLGLVSSYDQNTYAAKVRLMPEDVETGWLPIASQWVGARWGCFSPPPIGAQVLVLFQEGSVEAGIVVGALYSDEDRPLPVPAGEAWLQHQSGSFVSSTTTARWR